MLTNPLIPCIIIGKVKPNGSPGQSCKQITKLAEVNRAGPRSTLWGKSCYVVLDAHSASIACVVKCYFREDVATP